MLLLLYSAHFNLQVVFQSVHVKNLSFWLPREVFFRSPLFKTLLTNKAADFQLVSAFSSARTALLQVALHSTTSWHSLLLFLQSAALSYCCISSIFSSSSHLLQYEFTYSYIGAPLSYFQPQIKLTSTSEAPTSNRFASALFFSFLDTHIFLVRKLISTGSH